MVKCFLVLLGLTLGMPVFSNPVASWEGLLREAAQKQLAAHPYWLRLLHYKQPFQSPGQWKLKSDVTSNSFFAAPTGNEDPQAELIATLKAFFQPIGEDPNAHSQCRWIARFHWLQTQLDFPKKGLPKADCFLFNRWSNIEHVSSISLVFVSAYMSNPASIYGHNLLKINSSGNVYSHSLLSPTINFGATIPEGENAVTYALKGLLGGYTGRFSDERFYNYNHLYGENELRDLWEYELNLTPEQQRRIVYHTWELLHPIDFQYFFLRDNCAYRIAELLEMAWDEQSINPGFSLWAIPVETFHQIDKIRVNGQPLVSKVTLIPSRQRRLRARVDDLSTTEKYWVTQLTESLHFAESEAFEKLSDEEKVAIFDVLLDYYQYYASEYESTRFDTDRLWVLKQRSRIAMTPKPVSFEEVEPPTVGTPPTRFRFAHVSRPEKSFLETGVWTSYHDLLGPGAGHLPNSQLVTADIRLRLSENDIQLQQATIVDVQAVKTSPTKLYLNTPLSWRINIGWKPKDFACERCLVFQSLAGAGLARSLPQLGIIVTGFLDAFAQISSEYKKGTIFGLKPTFGIWRQQHPIWHFGIEVGRWNSLYGDKWSELQWQVHQRWTLTPRLDFRVEVGHFRDAEARVALHYYW